MVLGLGAFLLAVDRSALATSAQHHLESSIFGLAVGLRRLHILAFACIVRTPQASWTMSTGCTELLASLPEGRASTAERPQSKMNHRIGQLGQCGVHVDVRPRFPDQDKRLANVP